MARKLFLLFRINHCCQSGSSFTLTLQSGPDYEQGYGVWADWNRDGDFDDADEFVYQSATPTTAIVNAIINVPVTAALGANTFPNSCIYNEAPIASLACATWIKVKQKIIILM
ncbi:MAG: hypothetical protein IPL12_09325 [Bacteroidetes bacterium]|nr:hypothetical protein [Bacteroidota bacterium]